MNICKHLGKKIGIADAKCSGVYNLYNCNLLSQPCTAHNITVHSIRLLDNSSPPPTHLNCAHCVNNTSNKIPAPIPPKC